MHLGVSVGADDDVRVGQAEPVRFRQAARLDHTNFQPAVLGALSVQRSADDRYIPKEGVARTLKRADTTTKHMLARE